MTACQCNALENVVRGRVAHTFQGCCVDVAVLPTAGTVATRYKVLRILYGWLEEEDEIPTNPMAKVKPPIVPEQPVPVVPEDGLRRLLATCDGKSFENRRDTALILLLVDVGPRRAELMGLTLAEVARQAPAAAPGATGPFSCPPRAAHSSGRGAP
jgi:site-specific recombinase XerD